VTEAVTAAEPAELGGRKSRLAQLLAQVRALFPTAPETDRLTWRSALVGALAVAVATVASMLRQPGIPVWDTLWAEDGTDSLKSAVTKSFFDAVTSPVQGYYQTLPRLLAEPVALLPASWAAPAFAIESAGMTALFGLVVYVASGAHLRTPLARLVASAIVVVPPVGMADVPNSLCNLHWGGLYALLWVLLWTPRGRLGKGVAVGTALLVALTNILVVVFLPLAVVRLFFGPRGWYGRLLVGAVFLGALPQVLGVFTGVAASRQIESHPALLKALRFFVRQAVPEGLIGSTVYPQAAITTMKHWLVALAVWLVIALLVLLGIRFARPNWRVAALLAVHAFVFWMVSAGGTGLLAARYETTVAMFVVAALAAMVVPEANRAWGAPLVAFALALAVAWSLNYRPADLPRGKGPSWSAQIADARTKCAQPGVTEAEVRLSPINPYIDWRVSLPCSYVGRD
jgi:hypothetical protein